MKKKTCITYEDLGKFLFGIYLLISGFAFLSYLINPSAEQLLQKTLKNNCINRDDSQGQFLSLHCDKNILK